MAYYRNTADGSSRCTLDPPEETVEAMRTLGWLECAAWSLVDSTQIAIGVTVQGPQLGHPQQKDIHRIVLIDTAEKTARLLTE